MTLLRHPKVKCGVINYKFPRVNYIITAYEIDDECVNTVWTENADCKRQLLKVIGKPSLDWLKTDAKICCAINQFATCTTTRAYTKCGPESAMQLMEGLNILQSECNNHHKNGSLACQSPSSSEQMDCRIQEIITPCQQDFPNILKNGAMSMLPKDMNKHCRLLNNTVHCVKEKLEECYNDPAIKVEHTPIFLTGVLANLTTTTCTKDSRGKTAYDQYRTCLTSLDKEFQSCMDPYLKLPNNSQTTIQCCTIRKMTKCVVAQAESNCGAEAAEYIRSSVTILQGPEFKLWEMCNAKNMQSKGCDDTSSGYTPMLSNAIVIVLAFVFALY